MEMKYYNASNNFKAPIRREPKPYIPHPKLSGEVIIPQKVEETVESEPFIQKECECKNVKENQFTIIDNQDDLLLMGLILLLLINHCNDYLLILVLGYLLFCDKQ